MSWQRTRLGEVLPFRYGKGLPARSRTETGEYFVMSSAGITGTHDTPLTTGPSVVIGRKGTIGSTYYCPRPIWPIDTAFYVEASESVDIRFAYYLLKSLPLQRMNNDSAVPGLNRVHAENMEIMLPPLEEQRAIAATLGALDDKIESNGRVIKLIDEVVRARFDRDFNVVQAANGVAIGDLVSINRRHKLVRGEEATYVGMSSLPEFSPTIIEWERRAFGTGQKFVNGDVLMARITPCLENGKTAVADMLGDGEVGWGSTEYVVLSPRGAFSTPWIYALTRNQTIRDWAISRMTGTSGRQRFQATEFNQYRIQEPDSGVLAAFNDFAVPLFQKMTQARNESRLLQQLRDILLPELLSGRIRTALKGDA